ncbi:hypothetical protein [Streptomyces adelaidensis]|uniref:hypothetical protein n=1 Tax=Streptomyces adelaidensis TaxID=2796465 RepID=UPI001902FF03|nr:hypothetical protein [Streptomyces adelaidensis]
MFGFVSRRRHNAEVAALNADRDRLRDRAEKAEQAAETAKRNCGQAIRQFVEADATNRRLAGRNAELTRRLDDGTDAEYTARLEARVDRLTKAAGRYLNAFWTARREERAVAAVAVRARADQERLAERLKASEERARLAVQGLRPDEWESRPVDGAARVRRDEPSVELRRALDRCAELDERLAVKEGRPPQEVAS